MKKNLIIIIGIFLFFLNTGCDNHSSDASKNNDVYNYYQLLNGDKSVIIYVPESYIKEEGDMQACMETTVNFLNKHGFYLETSFKANVEAQTSVISRISKNRSTAIFGLFHYEDYSGDKGSMTPLFYFQSPQVGMVAMKCSLEEGDLEGDSQRYLGFNIKQVLDVL